MCTVRQDVDDVDLLPVDLQKAPRLFQKKYEYNYRTNFTKNKLFQLILQKYSFKGQCHEIFCFWFFHESVSHPAPEYPIRTGSNFFENSQRYSQVKVHHINDTGGKLWEQNQATETVKLTLLPKAFFLFKLKSWTEFSTWACWTRGGAAPTPGSAPTASEPPLGGAENPEDAELEVS